jgi:hypothetical protein
MSNKFVKPAYLPPIQRDLDPSHQKRHLPIHQKNMVYNEWGAIIKHQDEIDRALKLEEQKTNALIKQKYMAELDQQRAGIVRKQQEDR